MTIKIGYAVECDDDTDSDEDRCDDDKDGWQLDFGMPVRNLFTADVMALGGIHMFEGFLHFFFDR